MLRKMTRMLNSTCAKVSRNITSVTDVLTDSSKMKLSKTVSLSGVNVFSHSHRPIFYVISKIEGEKPSLATMLMHSDSKSICKNFFCAEVLFLQFPSLGVALFQ